MSDAPTTDPNLSEDDPNASPPWTDPDGIPDFARDYNEDEKQLAKLLRPGAELEPDPTEPDPVETSPEPEVDEVEDPPVPPETPPAEPDPTPTAPEPAPTPEPEPDFIDIGGRLYPRERAAEILQLIDMGIAQVTNTPLVPAAPTVPDAPTGPDVPAFDPNDYADTELARATQAQLQSIRDSQAPVAEKLDRVEQILMRQEQAAEQARLEQMRVAETAAIEDIRTNFSLNDAEMAELYSLTERSGVVNGLAAANPALMGDMKQLATEAMTMVYWGTEKFRERDIQREVSAKVQEQVQTQKVTEKKSKAGGLVGGGGNVQRETAAPKSTRDPMAEALAAVSEEVV